MKVLGIISSLKDPSPRVRLLNYSPYLRSNNVMLTPRYFHPNSYADPAPWAYKLNKLTRISPWRFLWAQKTISRLPLLIEQYKYDLIWQNRLILPHQSYYEKRISVPVIFDYDDAIWLRDGEKQVAAAIARAAFVFAGNEYLAEFGARYNKNVMIIPSVIDTSAIYPIQTESVFFTIGWIGTISNFPFLDLVKPALQRFLAADKHNRFMVISSAPPPQFEFDDKQLVFKKWSLDKENELLNEISAGIMPLADNQFTKGKCSYKMLQYLACGKPAIVSPVGMNAKVLNEGTVGLSAGSDEEWFNAFLRFKNDHDFYKTCSQNARPLIENKYSVNRYAPEILGYFKKIPVKKIN